MSANSLEQKPTILVVAHYILATIPDRPYGLFVPMLQKLCYYSQVCSLVYYHEPLIETTFEAWKNGPVNRELHETLRGVFMAYPRDLKEGYGGVLSARERGIVNTVVKQFGGMWHQSWLRQVRAELPYRQAWQQGPGTPISHQTIIGYYEPEPK